MYVSTRRRNAYFEYYEELRDILDLDNIWNGPKQETIPVKSRLGLGGHICGADRRFNLIFNEINEINDLVMLLSLLKYTS